MNLQFLSGNPIAKRSKKRKAKKVNAKKKGPRMGSKKKFIRKNPDTYYATKGKLKADLGKAISPVEAKSLLTASRRLKARSAALKKDKSPKARLLGFHMEKAAKKATIIRKSQGKSAKKILAKAKKAIKSGAKISHVVDDQVDKVLSQAGITEPMKKYLQRKETKMAKKAKKKVAKKVSKKKVAKKVAKKAAKKVAKKAVKKSSKKRSVKRVHKKVARKASAKRVAKKVSKKVSKKIYKFKRRKVKSVKIAKSRKSLSVYLKNPLKGAGAIMGKASELFEQGTGLDLKEAGLLVGAGASIGTLEALVSKYGQQVITKLPVQLQSAAPALIVGVLGSVGHAVASKKLGKDHLAVEALKAVVAASIVRVASATLSSTVNKVLGMAGVDFTPMKGIPQLSSMRGVDYTPMAGVDYTPMAGIPKLSKMGNINPGSMGFKSADFGSYDMSDYGAGGGYTEGRKRSNADFGGVDIEDLEALEDDSDSDDNMN